MLQYIAADAHPQRLFASMVPARPGWVMTGNERFELPAKIDRYLATLSRLYEKERETLPQEGLVNRVMTVHEVWNYNKTPVPKLHPAVRGDESISVAVRSTNRASCSRSEQPLCDSNSFAVPKAAMIPWHCRACNAGPGPRIAASQRGGLAQRKWIGCGRADSRPPPREPRK